MGGVWEIGEGIPQGLHTWGLERVRGERGERQGSAAVRLPAGRPLIFIFWIFAALSVSLPLCRERGGGGGGAGGGGGGGGGDLRRRNEGGGS